MLTQVAAMQRQLDETLLTERHRLRQQLRRLTGQQKHKRAKATGKDVNTDVSASTSMTQSVLNKKTQSVVNEQTQAALNEETQAALNKKTQAALEKLQQRIDRSVAAVTQRRGQVPQVDYPQELPIAQKREQIAAAIEQHQVVIVAGETGSGKTTQLPKICLELGRGVYGRIGHTQPRRLAARTVAARIAEELKTPLGQQVGYQVRFSDQVSDNSLIKLMTDGILLSEIQHDPYLNQYDTLIIDEAHERSLNIDFLLGYLRRLLAKRPELKLIVTSATIDVERFAAHFNQAPVIEVSGRTYPVEVMYQAMPDSETDEASMAAQVVAAVETIQNRQTLPRERAKGTRHARGTKQARDILVFLSGEREIREVARVLKQQHYRHLEVLPLYARLSNAEQQRVFQPHKGQRIVLATNVAETSLTVPGIGYVIDTGLARISRYSVRSKIQRLPIEAISQASANQRMGRCGRIAEGFCVRLYTEDDFNQRPAYTEPEIRRTNLAAVILQMLNLRLGDIERFPFIDKPDPRAIRDGFNTLMELGAVDDNHRLTSLGKRLARFPLDPAIARMLIAAAKESCLTEVLVIAAALSIQDPRERPMDKQQRADQLHREYQDPHSDFVAYLNLWRVAEEQRQALSSNQFSQWCKKRMLSYLRMREWRETHRQLLLVTRELKLTLNQQPAEYEGLHRALLTGLLAQVGLKDDSRESRGREYQGARNRRFYIFPGSGVFKKSPKWLMAAELVETSKLYARTVARIDSAWIEQLAPHLVKRSHAEPHWSRRRGQVIAVEQVSLYGLTVARHQVDFSRVDPAQARELFIRSALVEADLASKLAFYQHNLAQVEAVEALEHQSRRRDILVDDEAIYAFYQERIPADVCSLRSLEAWCKKAAPAELESLCLDRSQLVRADSTAVELAQFPKTLDCGDFELALSYHFEPGAEDDGVTAELPITLINQVPAARLEWLVPGLLREKCIALVKQLPKPIRKQLVPVPDRVDRALLEMQSLQQSSKNAAAMFEGSLYAALAHALKRLYGVVVDSKAWNNAALEPYFQMNIRVVDEAGEMLAQGRDIAELRLRLRDRLEQSLQQVNTERFERTGITRWDFGRLDQPVAIEQAGMQLKTWPMLVDAGDSVTLRLADNPETALDVSRQGILRLYQLATAAQVKYLKKNLPKLQPSVLLYAALLSRVQASGVKASRMKASKLKASKGKTSSSNDPKRQLVEGLLYASYARVFIDPAQQLPMDAETFTHILQQEQSKLLKVANETAELVHQVLASQNALAATLKGRRPEAWAFVYEDIEAQLRHLIPADFLITTPWQYLQHYPRYLTAITERLDKIQNQLPREREWCQQLQQFWQTYEDLLQTRRQQALETASLQRFRWALEEYRVSLYAQRLGTSAPVSVKRLNAMLADH